MGFGFSTAKLGHHVNLTRWWRLNICLFWLLVLLLSTMRVVPADGIKASLQRKGLLFQDHYRRPSFVQWKNKSSAIRDPERITVTNPANGKQLCTYVVPLVM
jgi:hypothetical protein